MINSELEENQDVTELQRLMSIARTNGAYGETEHLEILATMFGIEMSVRTVGTLKQTK